MTLADQRLSYTEGQLPDADLPEDPLATLTQWISEASKVGDIEANAMALATVAADGTPSVRHVLCKGVSDHAVRFYTNLGSRKATELQATHHAAVTFWWPSLQRSVRVIGRAEPLPQAVVNDYFASRPHGSRIGAWSSNQSQPVANRAALEAQEAATRARFSGEEPTTPPPGWGGYDIVANEVELWHGREDRLHDRLQYRRNAETGAWICERLQP